jgi:hypothetical protein
MLEVFICMWCCLFARFTTKIICKLLIYISKTDINNYMKSLVLLALVLGLVMSTSITSPQLLVELQSRTENVIDDGVDLLS